MHIVPCVEPVVSILVQYVLIYGSCGRLGGRWGGGDGRRVGYQSQELI